MTLLILHVMNTYITIAVFPTQVLMLTLNRALYLKIFVAGDGHPIPVFTLRTLPLTALGYLLQSYLSVLLSNC